MTCYLAPESTRPSSITSERYFQQFNFLNRLLKINDDKRNCLFGQEYEQELSFYIAKYAEANCDDRVCLIGVESAWAIILQERLFLNKTILFIDCNLQQDAINKQLSTNKFDRIILLNCLHKINNSSILPVNLLHKSLTKDGRLIIIYREPITSTLPLPSEVLTKWYHAHVNSRRLIEQIYREQRRNIEIYQRSEIIKFHMKKLDWFSLLYNQMFYPLNLINQKQILYALRQMNETYFKYNQDLSEIHERLVFLFVQKTIDIVPYFQRSIQKTLPNRVWHSQISITDEINQLINLKKQKQYQK